MAKKRNRRHRSTPKLMVQKANAALRAKNAQNAREMDPENRNFLANVRARCFVALDFCLLTLQLITQKTNATLRTKNSRRANVKRLKPPRNRRAQRFSEFDFCAQPLHENQSFPTTLPLYNIWVVLAICLLVAVSYFPATMAGLVWDDVVLSLPSPVHSWNGLWDMWLAPNSMRKYEGHYWPLLYTTFWLEHKIWGVAPLGYHIVNMLLHATVTVLLWRLLLRLDVPGAMFAAAVFAVHPLHVESVVWVIGRKDILATLFLLLAVLNYIGFIERRCWWRYGAAIALFVASMMSKSIAITLPFSLLLWYWWKAGRVSAIAIATVLPFLAIGLVIATADWLTYKGREVISFDFSFLERVLLAARALWLYIGKLLWPTELAVIYQRWEVSTNDWFAWGCLLATAVVLGLLWCYRQRIGRGPLAGALFFAITLSPTLGFLDYGYMQFAFVADRYQYFAGIGVLVTLSAGLVYALRQLPLSGQIGVRLIAALSMLALLAVMGTLSWKQSHIYQHDGAFFEHVLSINPQARSARHNYGNWLQKQGRVEEALVAYRGALESRPNYANIHNKIGTALERLGQFQEAKESYRRALDLKPSLVHAKNNLALRLTKELQYSEALKLYRELLQASPNYAHAYAGMGIALFGMNRPDAARRSFERALELDPSIEAARVNLAQLNKLLEGEAQ